MGAARKLRQNERGKNKIDWPAQMIVINRREEKLIHEFRTMLSQLETVSSLLSNRNKCQCVWLGTGVQRCMRLISFDCSERIGRRRAGEL